jgi:hypothetical protein
MSSHTTGSRTSTNPDAIRIIEGWNRAGSTGNAVWNLREMRVAGFIPAAPGESGLIPG